MPEPTRRPESPLAGSRPRTVANGWRGGPTPPGPDGLALLKALGRRWFLALSLCAICGTAALAAAWSLIPPRYTATAQVRIASTAPRLAFNTIENNGGRSDFSTYQKTQAAALKNHYVLNAVLKRDDVKRLGTVSRQTEQIAWLEDELKIVTQEGSEIVSVMMSDSMPDELVVLVNAVVQEYLNEVNKAEGKLRGNRVAELDDIYNKKREAQRLKREALRKRAEEAGTSDSQALTAKQMNLLSTLGELKRQHAQVKFDRMRAEGKLATFQVRAKTVAETPVPEAMLNEAAEADASVKNLNTRLGLIQDAIDKYVSSGVRDDHGRLVELRAKHADVKKQIESRRAELRGLLLEKLRQKLKFDTEAELARLQDELVPLQKQEESLGAELALLGKEADKIGTSSTELEALRGEIQQEEKALDRVGDELQAWQVEMRSPPRVSLYQEAVEPKKDLKRQVIFNAMPALAAVFLACFGVAWWEYRARRVHSADEVVKALGMRVVGAVPALPNAARLPLVTAGADADGKGQLLQESIDGIRTVLLRDASVEVTQVVMVTSADSGEGKTTLAANLAGSLARAGRKTLLIDCDLRRPAAHQLFEQALQPGFSEVLLAEVELADALRPTTAVDGLWLLPAGQWDREVMQALARDGLKEVFERLKREFDFIILDSHPVLAATDSLLIGQHTDAVLLSLLRDVSQVPRVYAAGQQLTNLGIRVLGAVVNGMRPADVYSTQSYQPALQPAA